MIRFRFLKDYSGSHLENELEKSKTRGRELEDCLINGVT